MMNEKDRHVQNLIEFIDCNYSQNLTLEKIAQPFIMSKSFYIEYISYYSNMKYIQYKKTMEAQKPLKASTKSATEICYQCGFNNIQHFGRVFITRYQHHPRKIQKSNLMYLLSIN